ncbi:DUF2520 domain-containing protein [Vallitalea pronyensis]|uniref:DUF2520 domain-containing protein n=1 Tax=Vallitalea pronyensis TaxID=1348613 RepID=A0A8J8SFP7_9FIRM|nr:Rossmann-like and DUF2520 domain-containing protein [Vallitalea pronyensis]QUI21821.1 DUF2520 domain-containing protein [Vallitalea pronyensis]
MIGFIGAGKVGRTLGRYFAQQGIAVTGYYSRSMASAHKAATMTNSSVFNNKEELVESADYMMLTVPDDVIHHVAHQLSQCKCKWQTKVICHTSGVHPSTLLKPLEELGATVASLHPMLSFANVDAALEALCKTPLTLEGNGKKMDDLKQLLQDVHLHVRTIKTEQKALYHAGACMVSNYLVTLMDIGFQSFKHAGFDVDAANQLIAPLATATLNNYVTYGSEKALTGPLTRGDLGTITTHIQALSKEDKHLETIYRLLGLKTLHIVEKQKQLDEYTLYCLKEVLQDEKNNDPDHQKQEEEK